METIENPVLGERITFLQTSRQTGGNKSLMECYLSPKGGVPLHYHRRFTETFKIIEGQLNVQVGNKIKTLKSNETATSPININHRFYNTSGKPVLFTCELTPGSEGFENVIRIGCGLATDGKTTKKGIPKNLWHMAILMNMGEVYLVGIFKIFEKFFRFLAKTNKGRKIEKELVIKYCNQINT